MPAPVKRIPAHVVDEIRQPVDPPRVADLLFLLIEPAHRAHGAVTRLIRGKTLGDAFLDLLLQVKLELLFELALHPAAAENGSEPQRRREPPVFHPHEFLSL